MCRDRRLTGFLSVIAMLFTVAGAAYAIPPNLMLDNSPGSPMTHSAPMIRGSGNKVVAVWNDTQTSSTTEQRIHYAVSTDSGATFTDLGAPPQPVNGSGTWRWRGDPQLVVDPSNGAFYCAALATVGGLTGVAVVRGAFSGATLVWGSPVIAATFTAGIRPGLLALAAGSSGSLHLLIHASSAGQIQYVRSTDGNGASWSSQVTLSSPADAGLVGFPRIVTTGTDQTLYAAWVGPVGYGSQPIRLRMSQDLGASWNPEQTPVTMRMNPIFPGMSQSFAFPGTHRTAFSMALNGNSPSNTYGRLALAWGESWSFADEPFPALTGTVLRNESEPNADQFSATPFNVGDALIGTFADAFDIDWWTVNLAAGATLGIWGDSTSNATVRFFILGPDAQVMDNGFSGTNNAVMFRAPVTGTYWIRAEPAPATVPNFYRLRTRTGFPAAGEARDQRDIAVAYQDGITWTTNRWTFGPVGYDDYLPTIGFAADGLDYVTWYDLSRGSLSGTCHLVVARNLAGKDPVASPPVTVTDAETSWNDYLVFFPPGVGIANDVSGDDRRVHLAWTDTRGFGANAFATRLATRAFETAFPHDTTVTAGSIVTLRARVTNRNPEFEEKVFARLTGARGWWPGELVVRDSIPPASNGIVSIPIAIPDTAAAGLYTVMVSLERQSGILLRNDPVTLTIQNTTGIGEGSAIPRLDPIAPNPARGTTRVAFTLARSGVARVEVFGLQGERVRTLARGTMVAGPRSLEWNGRDQEGRPVPAGLYFVALETAGFRAVRPVVIVR